MILRRFVPLLFVASTAAACVTMAGTAQTRAANDLKCPENQVTVTNIGGTSFRAAGCGQEATYNCMQTTQNAADIACVREEQHGSPK